MIQTEAKGETGATMERTGEEEGILPERSEWFRSRGIIGTRDRVSQCANIVGFCSKTTARPLPINTGISFVWKEGATVA